MKRDDDSHLDDDARFEREAAAVQLAHGGAALEDLPPHLARRIEADAVRHVQNAHAARRAPLSGSSTTAAGAQVVVVEMKAARPARKLDVARWSGWLAAAACASLFAASAYRNTASNATHAANESRLAHDAAARTFTVDAPGPAAAEVEWNDDAQRGTLRIRNLHASEAATEYQVWLAQTSESERLPIPVGRFSVGDGAEETKVALTAPVVVRAPDRIIVTREARGGVLVSKREHVVLEGRLRAR